jgi:uncharacterized membrane protein
MVTTSASAAVASAATKASQLGVQLQRIVSVDVLRGLVMVIMALDHVRDYFTNFPFATEDVAHTYPALFFTRFITHFCAPVFSFLAGTGAYLATRRGKSRQQISWFFLTRGLWLVILELTVIDFAWTFVPWGAAIVIWMLGWSMVCMAAIVWLPTRWIAVFGVAMVAGHNLMDGIRPEAFGRFAWLWTILHAQGQIQLTAHFNFLVLYVLIPWVGVMAAGFAFGAIFERPDRRKQILRIGLALTMLFFVLRGVNHYGNGTAGYFFSSGPWSVQPTASSTIISFLNTEKYPPSLDYLLMTLGPALILLGLMEGVKAEGGISRILLVYGRVPMFYYVLHIYLVHVAAIVVAWASHQPADWLWHGAIFLQRTPDAYGHGLPFTYAIWGLVIGLLYLPCRWYMEFKQRHRDWTWLSYL